MFASVSDKTAKGAEVKAMGKVIFAGPFISPVNPHCHSGETLLAIMLHSLLVLPVSAWLSLLVITTDRVCMSTMPLPMQLIETSIVCIQKVPQRTK